MPRVLLGAALALAFPAIAGAADYDARWCGVRYLGAVNVYQELPNDPYAKEVTSAYRQRARAVLVNAGLMKPTATDIPKDIRDEGEAYGMSYIVEELDYKTFHRQITGCDKANGWVAVLD